MESQTPELEAIVKRLEKLEAQNRRLKRVGVWILIAFLTCTALLIWKVPLRIEMKVQTEEARTWKPAIPTR